MGFKIDVTEYINMITEYDHRGLEMRRAREVYLSSIFNRGGPSYEEPRTVSREAQAEEDRLTREAVGYEYSCQRYGCDGMTCGH